MHRFYVAPEHWNPNLVVLRESQVHHARDVLRLEPGERVVVFNGRGHEITAEITRKLSDFLDGAAPLQLRLIGSLQSDALHLKRVLAEYESEHEFRPTSVLMCIGPEGDFTPAELNLARSHGCRPITLGPIILRVETAAIYCLSVLSYELLAERR